MDEREIHEISQRIEDLQISLSSSNSGSYQSGKVVFDIKLISSETITYRTESERSSDRPVCHHLYGYMLKSVPTHLMNALLVAWTEGLSIDYLGEIDENHS
jgi:hypothetical protein